MINKQENKKPIEGKVAGILSERELVINIGTNKGVQVGMKFKVLTAESTDIHDPETNELLTSYDREKTRVETQEVYEKYSICKTYRKYTNSSIITSFEFLKPSRTFFETLKTEGSEFSLPLSEEESYVKKGDRVMEVIEGMISLGIYTTSSGERYHCNFLPDSLSAIAIGPLPKDGVGSRGIAFEVNAETGEDARKKLSQKMGEGNF